MTEKEKDASRLKALREVVPRKAGGRFAPGNKHATERRTKSAEKLALIRAVPSNTPIEWVEELWLRLWAMAMGAPDDGIQPVEWAVREVLKYTWGSRHEIANSDRVTQLEAEIERIYSENPKLAPTLAERVGPLKALEIASA